MLQVYYGKCSKISNIFLFLFSNKMLFIRAGIHKLLVKVANREDPGQTAFLDRPFWQAVSIRNLGAQWLSGRVLDSRPRGRGFEAHRRHCVVVLEQDTFILA